MQNALIRMIVLQFFVYAIFVMLGFVAWAISFSNNAAVLEIIIGKYLSGHLARWTTQFSWWGIPTLISATLALAAVWFLRKSRKEGGHLGIISFLLGSGTNILFAQNMLVHCLIGGLIGWTLLFPLVFAWKDLPS